MKTQSYFLELHYKRPVVSEMTTIKRSPDVDKYLRESICLNRIDHKEFFWVIMMTRSNQILGISEISSGKTHLTTISFKELVQLVALSNACGVILVHNHPSGNLNPSESDKYITKKAKEVLDLIDVILYEHLIITSEGYYSFVDNKLIIIP